jgi:hypothetical protein
MARISDAVGMWDVFELRAPIGPVVSFFLMVRSVAIFQGSQLCLGVNGLGQLWDSELVKLAPAAI